MTEDAMWSLEEAFWTGGAEHYASALDPDCIMAFPAVGILTGPAILDGLRAAPRWSSVAMSERRSIRPADDLVVLAYRAEGRREGAAAYEAYCTSTYRCAEDGWRLVQHQQTPI